MFITKTTEMPNGAIAEIHMIAAVNFSPEGGVATVNSYKVGSNVISWQDRYDIPENAMTGPPLQSVANFLVSPGAAFEGGEVLGDQGDLQVQRSLLKSRINLMREMMIKGGVDTSYGRVDTNDEGMRNISGFVAEATLSKINGTPFSMPFKLSDNSIVMLDADQMIEVGKAVSLHGQRMYAKSWELKALADAATTTEELDAIDINAGWLD